MRCLIFAAILLIGAVANAEQLRVVSWNINNLHHTEGESIPGRTGAPKRTGEDYRRLKTVLGAPELSGDVIALQETNGPEAVRKVLPGEPAEWTICHESRFDRDAVGDFAPATKPDRIYTALAVRKAAFDEVTCTELKIGVVGGDGRPSRDAAGAILRRGARTIHAYSVHMKSRCHEDSIDEPSTPDCRTLSKHVDELEKAIDDLTVRGVPFLLAGDYNRRFNRAGFDDQTDEFWLRIDDGTPAPLDLERAPKGGTGPCWQDENPAFRQPIDYFVFDEEVWPLVKRDAQGRPDFFKFSLTRFSSEVSKSERNRISDHCPIRTTVAF
jgi:hypothetical protein